MNEEIPAEVVAMLRLYHEDKVKEDELLRRLRPYLVSPRAYVGSSPKHGADETREENT